MGVLNPHPAVAASCRRSHYGGRRLSWNFDHFAVRNLQIELCHLSSSPGIGIPQLGRLLILMLGNSASPEAVGEGINHS